MATWELGFWIAECSFSLTRLWERRLLGWTTRTTGEAAKEMCRTATEAGCRAMAVPTLVAGTDPEAEEGGR